MLKLLIPISLLIPNVLASAEVKHINYSFKAIQKLAFSNNLNPSHRVINSILVASKLYNVNALDLTAIGIVETGLGKYNKIRKNHNGTIDRGLFQINTINVSRCIEYNLDSPEGSALCAAKLLSQIKTVHKDYVGVYHSKTKSKKKLYLQKISKVFTRQREK